MVLDERAMLAFVNLAVLSQQKKQMIGRDKFLLLAAASACRTGYAEVAARCRALVLSNNPAHLIGKSATVADAMRHPDFQPFLQQLERSCTYERAEHLLHGLGIEPPGTQDGDAIDSGALAMRQLTGESWPA